MTRWCQTGRRFSSWAVLAAALALLDLVADVVNVWPTLFIRLTGHCRWSPPSACSSSWLRHRLVRCAVACRPAQAAGRSGPCWSSAAMPTSPPGRCTAATSTVLGLAAHAGGGRDAGRRGQAVAGRGRRCRRSCCFRLLVYVSVSWALGCVSEAMAIHVRAACSAPLAAGRARPRRRSEPGRACARGAERRRAGDVRYMRGRPAGGLRVSGAGVRALRRRRATGPTSRASRAPTSSSSSSSRTAP